MRADRKHPVINKLRRSKATKFVVTLRDATTRDIPLSTAQNKWEKLLDIIEKLPWVAIEGQTDSGATLVVCENDDPDDDEDDDEGGDEGYDPVAAATERISKQMLTLMIQTQQETRKGYEATLRGCMDMMGSMVSAVSTLRDTYTAALRVRDMAELGRADDGMAGSSENMMKLLGTAMQLMQMQSAKPAGGVTLAPTINVTPKPATPTKPSVNGVAPKS